MSEEKKLRTITFQVSEALYACLEALAATEDAGNTAHTYARDIVEGELQQDSCRFQDRLPQELRVRDVEYD